MIGKIKGILDKSEYKFYGILLDLDCVYEVGDTCEYSYLWKYNKEFNRMKVVLLDGTRCIGIYDGDVEEALCLVDKMYSWCSYIILIGGNSCKPGKAYHEIIIKDAVVLFIIHC